MSIDVPVLPAASVLVLRDGPLEVLMLQRVATASFVPNAWVFPGGVVDQLDGEIASEIGDGSPLTTMKYAAVRELFEEAGLWLGAPLQEAQTKRRRLLAGSLSLRHLLAESTVDLDKLVWTSRWITPIGVPKRFDTYFFLTVVDRSAIATAHEEEAVEAIWIEPRMALDRTDLQLVFPTIKNLEAIAGFQSSEELLASRRGAEIPTMRPMLVQRDGKKQIVLP